jgi:acyl-CoA synthetase (AMP-forming)/AMP-acid ligase II
VFPSIISFHVKDLRLPPSPNIAGLLPELAARQPDKPAVKWLRGQAGELAGELSFAALEGRCRQLAGTLAGAGITRGMRVLVLVRPGLDFVPLTFAIFRLGAVAVFLDPGMGLRRLARAAAQAAPEAMIGEPMAHLFRLLMPGAFRGLRIIVTLGRPWGWGGTAIAPLRHTPAPGAFAAVPAVPTAAMAPDEPAAILFTSGSTGPAKGVVYTHGIFTTQVRLLRQVYGIGDTDTDLPCFPLFGLFSTAMGATVVVPDIVFSHPAKVDPRRVINAINRHGVTFSFGSPALWRRVGEACRDSGSRLPGLRQVFMAGAPVSPAIHALLLEHALPPGATTHTPYGATESLPVATFTGAEVLGETAARTRAGAGMCVGRPVPEATVRIIRLIDAPIPAWDDTLCLPQGEIGEIVVRGPMVTPAYFNQPEPTRAAKIPDRDGALWHRIGDAGYLDAAGRLWFCGRKNHRVRTPQGTRFSIPCEGIFNQHPAVARTALIGRPGPDGLFQPALAVEPLAGQWPRTAAARHRFAAALGELGRQSPLTRDITTFFFVRAFPVDVRHNVKIGRETLAAWAAAHPRQAVITAP